MAKIYDKPVRSLMKDMLEYLAPGQNETFTRKEAFEWFGSNYPKIKSGTIQCHLLRLSINAPSRVHYKLQPGDDDLFFQIDSGHFRRYSPGTDPVPIFQQDEDTDDESASDSDREEESGEFAYEKDLRNYLARNLGIIESGLRLYQEDEGVNGIEFPVGGRFADILAVDSDSNLVVIELKVSRGYDRVVGQLARYMGWIHENQADVGQAVRGVIVARQISDDLRLACSLFQKVSLFEYTLSLDMSPVIV